MGYLHIVSTTGNDLHKTVLPAKEKHFFCVCLSVINVQCCMPAFCMPLCFGACGFKQHVTKTQGALVSQ